MTEHILLLGFIHFFSETGTEGGYWAFQDKKFISANTSLFSCRNCSLYWNKKTETEAQVLKKAREFGNATVVRCEHDFQLVSRKNWSYEGLHILKNGDQLKIFSNDSLAEVVWKGEIQLKEHGPFTEHAGGLWIHSDQIGVARDTWSAWFFKGLPAELTPC